MVLGAVPLDKADRMLQREQATLTSLSESNSTLLTSFDAQNQTIARLETRSADLDRQLVMSTASERTSRTALRSAETRLRTLKEEMARLKLTVKEIRAQCANDVRKRDSEMQRLKKHLEGRRGVNGNPQVGVMVITPGNNSKGSRQQHQQALQASEEGSTSTDPRSPSYSLKEETTEFLIQLSQGLSDENDQLIHLVKTTLTTLRSLSGLPEPPSPLHQQQNSSSTNVIVSLPPSYDELESSTQEVLTHLRHLLSNPSFVPLEEVEIREDEILRLREGWERMAARWKDAVALMDGWRKRMVDTGGGTVTVNLDDLTQGLDLDVGGLGILEDHHPSGDAAESEAKNGNGDVGGANAGDDDGAGEEQLSTSDSIIDEKEALNSPEAPSLDDNASSEPSFTDPTPLPSRRGALRCRSGNARTFPPPRKISLSKLVAKGNPNDHSSPSAGNTDRNARKPKVRRTSWRKSPTSASPTTQVSHPFRHNLDPYNTLAQHRFQFHVPSSHKF